MFRHASKILHIIAVIQIAIVTWDALALAETYGIRRAQADAASYLTMAASLLRGEGLKSFSLYEPLPYGWITDWPLGYPAAIALFSHITGIDPIYASRLLNVILYASTYLILLAFYGNRGVFLFLFLWPPNFTWTVVIPLSEALFMPLFILLIAIIEKHLQHKRLLNWLFISVFLCLLFLTRYAGIAIGLGLGVAGIWFLVSQKNKEALLWIATATIQALFATGYFLWNASHHPLGESGLSVRDMPMPTSFFYLLWKEVPFIRLLIGIVAITILLILWKGAPTFPAYIKDRQIIQGGILMAQIALYAVSMVKGRVGIVDYRHFFVMFLPLLWICTDVIMTKLPSESWAGIALLFLAWQIRNTFSHYRHAQETETLPYKHWEEVKQAYDTLPIGACIIGGNIGYGVKGSRTDLCLGGSTAYWPILMRRCSCIYIDCGAADLRYKLSLSDGVLWPFVRFCKLPCGNNPICLQPVRCTHLSKDSTETK
ncbi:MAG: hypothetical protein RMJ66_00775 [Bacteroidia bacterium]|nr:hypothetical protein [Bacteroidia bacterium]MDW8133578.1 hypothetical protein [Bacteroidia bacterium]